MNETPPQIWRNKEARNLRFKQGMDSNPGNMLTLAQRAEVNDPVLLKFVEDNLKNSEDLIESELQTSFPAQERSIISRFFEWGRSVWGNIFGRTREIDTNNQLLEALK